MIDSLIRDFTENELESFALKYIDRHDLMCRIIGEFILDGRHLNIVVVLPYKDDKGCISAAILEKGKINIVDIRYF